MTISVIPDPLVTLGRPTIIDANDDIEVPSGETWIGFFVSVKGLLSVQGILDLRL